MTSKGNTSVKEYCVLYFAGFGDKIEIYPLPEKSDLLVHKACADHLVKALNYLSLQGWKLKKVINVKKSKQMQYLFERPLKNMF